MYVLVHMYYVHMCTMYFLFQCVVIDRSERKEEVTTQPARARVLRERERERERRGSSVSRTHRSANVWCEDPIISRGLCHIKDKNRTHDSALDQCRARARTLTSEARVAGKNDRDDILGVRGEPAS